MSRIDNPAWRLRGGFTPPVVLENVADAHGLGAPFIPRLPKLGLHLGTHKPKLKLADYLDRAAAPPPAAITRPHAGFPWGMLANDMLGDCVCAMILHSIADFHLDAGTPVPAFIDEDAILLYEKIGGYDPKDPSTDQGCDEGVAMSTWEKGLPKTSDGVVHKIAGTVAVDPADLVECRIAIDEFVDLQIGIALPTTAQGQAEWEVVGDPSNDPDSAPGSWGGHGIPFREYDAETFKCVTWGAELLLTVPFHQAYSQEAHVVVTREMLNKTGTGPSGVQWGDLVSDLSKLKPAKSSKEKS
jgi:hypothetical protein